MFTSLVLVAFPSCYKNLGALDVSTQNLLKVFGSHSSFVQHSSVPAAKLPMQSQTISNHYSNSSSAQKSSAPRSQNIMQEKSHSSTVVSPVASACLDPKDDVDIMLLHEDFPYLLSIAAKTKETRRKIAAHSSGTLRSASQSFLPKKSLQPDEVLLAVERMQEALLQRPGTCETIPRGRYPITDSIMEDSMLLLQQEHELGEKWLQDQLQIGRNEMSSKMKEGMVREGTTSKRGRATSASVDSKKEAIAVKYSKWQTDTLMTWMIEHKEQPFPDQDAIEWLMARTGLSHSQVVNWTTNVRKRNRKATCEGGKKPHHFIDFLFLAHDREIKARSPQKPITASQYGAPHYHKKPTIFPVYSSQADTSVMHQQPRSLAINSYHTQYHQEAIPAPDEYVSTNMFDVDYNFEPMPITTKPEDQIMADFADCWLDNVASDKQQATFAAYDLATAKLDDGLPLDSSGSDILPTVTDDSNDLPRIRANSFEFVGMDDEDLKQWVEDMGLGVEV